MESSDLDNFLFLDDGDMQLYKRRIQLWKLYENQRKIAYQIQKKNATQENQQILLDTTLQSTGEIQHTETDESEEKQADQEGMSPLWLFDVFTAF